MAYLHCHNCSFAQDDFWNEDGWNPVKAVENWKKELFSPKIDEPFCDDAMFIREHGVLDLREVLAREYESAAKRIRNMKYRTMEEFKEKNPERICPICKQKTLDID